MPCRSTWLFKTPVRSSQKNIIDLNIIFAYSYHHMYINTLSCSLQNVSIEALKECMQEKRGLSSPDKLQNDLKFDIECRMIF